MDLKTPDKDGYIPDLSMIGRKYKHWKNQKVYVVLGFQFDGDRDLWVIAHKCPEDISYENPNPVVFTRTPENFFEKLWGLQQTGRADSSIPPVDRFTSVT